MQFTHSAQTKNKKIGKLYSFTVLYCTEQLFTIWRQPGLGFVNTDLLMSQIGSNLRFSQLQPLRPSHTDQSEHSFQTRVFSEAKWKSGQLESRWNLGKIGKTYDENRSISGQKRSQRMFQLSFYQANLCVSEENANLEHIRSTFPICSEFGALLRFLEQLRLCFRPHVSNRV